MSIAMDLINWMDAAGSRRGFVSPKLAVRDLGAEGRGIVALEPVHTAEEIIRLPHSYLLNKHTVLKHVAHYAGFALPPAYANVVLPDMPDDRWASVYGAMTLDELSAMTSFRVVSMYLCVERLRASWWRPFLDSLPDMAAFELTPLVWRVSAVKKWDFWVQNLPPESRAHAERVYDRFMSDYNAVREYLETCLTRAGVADQVDDVVPLQTFLWAWMCVNSRCLYMDLAEATDRADKLTMAPYVDFINHSDHDHCSISVDGRGFHVKTTCAYTTDAQLYLSYGPHSNSFLLCEYGFTTATNRWNELVVDELVLKTLNEPQTEFLKSHNYYADYTVTAAGPSFRTVVALAVMQVKAPAESSRLVHFVKGLTDGESFARGSTQLLRAILAKYRERSAAGLALEAPKDPVQRRIHAVVVSLHQDLQQIIDAQE